MKDQSYIFKNTQKIFNKWNSLSDNGPWTGEEDKCYSTVTINTNIANVNAAESATIKTTLCTIDSQQCQIN